MGLDMYLYKSKFISNYDFDKEPSQAKNIKIKITKEYEDGTEDTETYDVDKPQFGVMLRIPFIYWRKANQIHKFFIDNCANGVDEGQDIYVDGEILKLLYDICKQIIDDPDKAQHLLPTQEGFFFGSTEYDEDYMDDVKDTFEQLKDCDFNANYIYNASW